MNKETADVCIITEGSYPYYPGGVSKWVDELIRAQKERTFHILSLVPPNPKLIPLYPFPENVIGHTTYIVQDLPKGSSSLRTPKQLWCKAEVVMKDLMSSPTCDRFDPLLELCAQYRPVLGRRILSESKKAWDFFIRLYKEMIPSGPFKASFATMFTLSRSLFSMMLPELPDAKIFHTVCTGYAGFLLYRAKRELKVPCLITEHGVYVSERRIEIAMEDWIADLRSLDLRLDKKKGTLKNFWLNAFYSMSYACYQSCDQILSTFEGTQQMQIQGGADPKKIKTVVHGINAEEYAPIRKLREEHVPTAALIGRVVPIKDVKTYIRACRLVSQKLPAARFFVIGSIEEDPEYYAECVELAESLGLKEKLIFTGHVEVKLYFPQIDLIVFTSVSEVQPLILLEAGSIGIPAIATNVGAAHDLIYGKEGESPHFGDGGIMIPFVSPDSAASAMLRLFLESDFYQKCSEAMSNRIKTFYRSEDEQSYYRQLYQNFLTKESI